MKQKPTHAFFYVTTVLLATFFYANTLLANPYKNCFVTYTKSGGRFGDNLVAYLHAKWISYRYNIPLLLEPFEYSDELVLSEKELLYSPLFVKRANVKEVIFDKLSLLENLRYKKFLLRIPYFPETLYEFLFRTSLSKNQELPFFLVDWEDTTFRELVRSLIAPKHPLKLITPPKGFLSVALHIRTGKGYDDPKAHLHDPRKFCPLSYFQQELCWIVNKAGNVPIYAFVFTDDPDPFSFVTELQEALPQNCQVVIETYKEDELEQRGVLEDFFSLFSFDCLIRSESNFSLIPSRLHDFLLDISPKDYIMQNDTVTITSVQRILSPERGFLFDLTTNTIPQE